MENTAHLPYLQQRVADFVAAHDLAAQVESRLLDLVSEVGEAAKEALKGSDYGRQTFRPTAAWAEELGDVLFSLICVANSTGVDLAAALETALAKYTRRLAQQGEAGSGR